MSRLVALLLILGLLFMPGAAFAEEYEFSPEVPKGMQDGIVCKVEATFGGNTFRSTAYVPADGDEMASDPNRERRWQITTCERWSRQDAVNTFGYRWSQAIDPASVRITWEPYSP